MVVGELPALVVAVMVEGWVAKIGDTHTHTSPLVRVACIIYTPKQNSSTLIKSKSSIPLSSPSSLSNLSNPSNSNSNPQVGRTPLLCRGAIFLPVWLVVRGRLVDTVVVVGPGLLDIFRR